MFRHRTTLLLAAVLLVGVAGQSYAIQRVAPRIAVLEFRGGYAMPLGSYDGIVGVPFEFDPGEIVHFDAERVYRDGLHLGISLGRLSGNHWQRSVGFDYARSRIENPIEQEIGIYIYTISFPEDLTYQQYDLTLRQAYLFNNLTQTAWNPYFGLSATAGLAVVTAPGFETESQLTFALGLDFGLDFKVWQAADNRSFVTLSSINSWDFLATGERVSYLQVGGGIKYYFRP